MTPSIQTLDMGTPDIRETLLWVPSSVALAIAWEQAVSAGQPGQAAIHRQRLDSLTDEEPTWVDAEWQ